jgi:hypothetical protein
VPLTKKLVSAMPIIFDITTDELYLEGLEKGLVKGFEKGITLELKRGDLTIHEIAEYFEVGIDFVISIQKKIQDDIK